MGRGPLVASWDHPEVPTEGDGGVSQPYPYGGWIPAAAGRNLGCSYCFGSHCDMVFIVVMMMVVMIPVV